MTQTVWTVTYQDAQAEALEPDQIRVFEDREAARFYALELAKKYDYINMYKSEVTDGFSR